MASNNNQPGSGEASRHQKIQPATVALSAASDSQDHVKASILDRLADGAGNLGWPAAGVVALLIVLIGVVMWMPRPAGQAVGDGASIAGTAVGESETAGEAPVARSLEEESPFEQAQSLRARRAAQDLLAELLDRKEQLEQLSVMEWAGEAFADALALAEVGDAHYRNRDFPAARNSYEAALSAADALVRRSQEVLAGALADGKSALGDLDSETAQTAFKLALLIDATDVDALAGLKRSGVIDQVTKELVEVDRLTAAGELAAAKALAEKLRQVDPLDPRLPGRITKLTTRIRDLGYVAAMSRGYEAIQKSDYSTAIAAFRQALAIKPGAADALQAIADAGNQSTQAQVTLLIGDARDAEASEDWYSALESYKAILAIEEKSVLGITGKVRVEARWKLDQQLESFLDDPDSILDPSVMERARQLHQDALGITARGPRLDKQTGGLGHLLDAVRVPVVIELVSDGETDVTLLKHGGLGKFRTHQLTIKPGKYVALGQRNGYRDVRVDFLVRADSGAQPVMVQCDEPIFKRS